MIIGGPKMSVNFVHRKRDNDMITIINLLKNDVSKSS